MYIVQLSYIANNDTDAGRRIICTDFFENKKGFK